MINLLKSGRVDPGTYVWKEGLDNWITMESSGLIGHSPKREPQMGEKVCPACAKPVRKGAKYCTSCGTRLP